MKHKRTIQVNPSLYFEKFNNSFNDEVESLIDDIFQTNRIKIDSYILVGDYILEQIKEFTPFAEIEKALDSYKHTPQAELIHSSKKAYENLVAHLMLHGGFDTYVIAGGMGSGKSSACDYIVDVLKKKTYSQGDFIINIKFDFNGPYDGNDEQIIALFKRQLYDKLFSEVESYFLENRASLDQFCQILSNKQTKQEYSEFNKFNKYNTIEWKSKYNIENKLEELFQYIEHYEDRLIPLMKLVHFIRHCEDNNTVIFVFDNIDILLPQVQRKILLLIFKYNNIAKIKCFIPLRRATFKRTLREIQKDQYIKATFSFGYIHHHGVEPITVVLERVKSFLVDTENNKLLQSINSNFKEEIIKRFVIYKTFLETDNSFSRFFKLISGRSSRVALLISKRFFVNNVINYKNHDFYYDLGIKCFMVNRNNNLLFSNDHEQDIANIFCSNIYGDFCFIPYLVLQYVKQSKSIEEYELRYIYIIKLKAVLEYLYQKKNFLIL